MAGFVRSPWWYPISSYISWAWSEVGTGGGKPREAAVLRHGAESRNRLSRGAWRPLLVIRPCAVPEILLKFPLDPSYFGKCFSKKNPVISFSREGCLPPGSSVVPVTRAYFPVLSSRSGTREVYIVLKSWNGIQNLMHVRIGGFFRCVMLFRIWLLIFNSANVPVCWK